jgi:hypothetical protein
MKAVRKNPPKKRVSSTSEHKATQKRGRTKESFSQKTVIEDLEDGSVSENFVKSVKRPSIRGGMKERVVEKFKETDSEGRVTDRDTRRLRGRIR